MLQLQQDFTSIRRCWLTSSHSNSKTQNTTFDKSHYKMKFLGFNTLFSTLIKISLTGEQARKASLVSGVRDAGGKRPRYPGGDQDKISDWREASRGARYFLYLKEKKRIKIMVKLFRYIGHKMMDHLLLQCRTGTRTGERASTAIYSTL